MDKFNRLRIDVVSNGYLVTDSSVEIGCVSDYYVFETIEGLCFFLKTHLADIKLSFVEQIGKAISINNE